LIPVLATFFFGMPTPLTSFLDIIICCFTDVFADIALCAEPAEGLVMLEPPRDVKKHLVDGAILLYAFLFYGSLQLVSAFYMYFDYMMYRGPTGMVADPVPSDSSLCYQYPEL
jgi:sodium/potassium-transporting ATPase subunit alpha